MQAILSIAQLPRQPPLGWVERWWAPEPDWLNLFTRQQRGTNKLAPIHLTDHDLSGQTTLAHGLIEHNACAHGDVEALDRARHRDADQGIAMVASEPT